ncbi:40S ribosomal protein S4-A [Tolypocladium paradoxum]|uniref:40S ribosomal protein S4-A n=1 Tax=Tolypocladium paradoxum TaxID=94208 RepID=A0A2S4L530_9HYPO|nr:40S ribosomal protein S4-A [Tolypocladium paradoxum]
MATIEPRLIHLLNESTTPQIQHADLPPLYALPLPASCDRPLPPIEPDASHRTDRYGADAAAFGATSMPLSLPGDEAPTPYRKDDGRWDGRHSGGSSAYPLRLLLGDSDAAEPSSHSHAKILNESTDAFDDAYNKKRARNLNVKDDFVQLPQPMKKQKAAQQALAMPPIINGLHEPPPHAALFPPIASNSFSENDASQMKLLHEFNRGAEDRANAAPSPDGDKNSSKGRKRAAKPRRKWSEEETKHLLLGVNRHGVGKWTTILEDPDFTFNDRTAGDLKDRFRTCCPVELRGPSKSAQPDSPPSHPREPKQKAKKGIHSENILIKEDSPSPQDSAACHPQDSDAAPRQKKSRAHRKKMEDLAELGIHGPFKKSLRRERRPFTDQDDREILEGLDVYGPAWTKIQRDPRFHLSSRQPTDLRDRVRNKYPAVYQRIEKGTFQAKDESRGNDILEPSINMSIDDSLKRSTATTGNPRISHSNSREELHAWPLQMMDPSSYIHPPQTFEFGEANAPHFMGGEMDISRLLLDDSRLSQMPTRHGIDGVSGPSSPSGYASEHRRGRHGGHTVKC